MASDTEENYLKSEEMEEGTFEEESEDEELDLCLLCCSKVKVDQKIVEKIEQVEQSDILYKNLTVIFLLKKVLQVPDLHLRRNLRKCGNPVNWLSLCDQCNELSRRAKMLHSHIVKSARMLRTTEQLILDKVKCSLEAQQLKKNGPNPESEQSRIWRITRELIKSYNYRNQSKIMNPFIEGDKLAEEQLANQQTSEVSLKGEEDADDVDDDQDYFNDDTIWEAAEEEPDQHDEKPEDQELKQEPEPPITISSNKLLRSSKKRNRKIKKSVVAKSFDLDDSDTILDEGDAKKEPAPELNEELDNKLKPESSPSTKISKESARLSRKKTKRLSISQPEVPPPPTKPRLKRNKIAHVKIYGKFKCNYCDKLFSAGGPCYAHEREKHADVPGQFPCDLCPSTYNSERYLNLHKRQTHKIKLDGTPYIWKPTKIYRRTPTICNICGKSVTNLRQHRDLVHENKVTHFCHVCGAGFKVATNLRQHLINLHKNDPVTLKMKLDGVHYWRCEVKGCNSGFMKKISLERHVERIHGNYLGAGEEERNEQLKSFVCEVCGKGFWKKDKLQRHELIHTKVK